tara:strand:- start:5829 stop:7166 length:1338 start_codon:yes stop_codon:yes gene_type:complete
MSEVEEIDISQDIKDIYDNIEQKISPQVDEIDVSSEIEPQQNILDSEKIAEIYENIDAKQLQFSTGFLPTDLRDEKLSKEETNIKNDLQYSKFADEAFKGKMDRDRTIGNYEYMKKYSNINVASYINNNKKEIVIAFKGTDFKRLGDELRAIFDFRLSHDERIELQKTIDEKESIDDLMENSFFVRALSQANMDLETYLGSFSKTLPYLSPFGKDAFLVETNIRIIDRLKNLYPDYNIVFTGFSLGGTLAGHSLSQHPTNNRAITFNHGTGIFPNFDEYINCIGNNCNIKNYRIQNDLISQSGLSEGDIITLKPRQEILDKNKDLYFPSHDLRHFMNRTDFKETSGFEKGDTNVINALGKLAGIAELDQRMGVGNILKSPQILMKLANDIFQVFRRNPLIRERVLEQGTERRDIAGRQYIGDITYPPAIGRPVSEMRRVPFYRRN